MQFFTKLYRIFDIIYILSNRPSEFMCVSIYNVQLKMSSGKYTLLNSWFELVGEGSFTYKYI